MKLEQIGARQWQATLPLNYTFTFGESIDNEDIFEVKTDSLRLQLETPTYLSSVFVGLGEILKQIKLKAFPHNETDMEFVQLVRAIETTIRSIGSQCSIREYGDEEEDFRPYTYTVCFSDGTLKHRVDTEEGFDVYTLVKYGDLRTLLIKRVMHNLAGRILAEHTFYLQQRMHIESMTKEEAVLYFK